MSRHQCKLTARDLKQAKRGLYSDGGGLYLQVSIGTKGRINRSWIFRYAVNGKDHLMGLGSTDTFNLDEAREMARSARQQRARGDDPLEIKRAQRGAVALSAAAVLTFKGAVDGFAKLRLNNGTKYAHDWVESMQPVIAALGKAPVTGITSAMILNVLRPMWQEKAATASRVRGRIQQVFDYALDGQPNPARLEVLKDKLAKVPKVENHACVPHAEMPALWGKLRGHDQIGYKAMQLVILTGCRANEVIGAVWAEIDLSTKVWTIPKERMKADRDHRVALSDTAVALLQSLPRGGKLVFPGERGGGVKPIAHSLMRNQLKELGYAATVHGFRSSFRTWAGDCTSFPREVIEEALAHTVGNAVERAYNRGDLMQKRANLMQAWAAYLTG